MDKNGRLTITEVAKSIGVTPRTIMRWEKAGKIKKSKRDWRGWRFYLREDVEVIQRFFESTYEYGESETAAGLAKVLSVIIAGLVTSLAVYTMPICSPAFAETDFTRTPGVTETSTSIDVSLDKLPVVASVPSSLSAEQEVKYTLGPDDIIAIDVRRHPEFSGEYNINSEGKIEYKFVGDLFISGMTKLQLKEELTKILSDFVVDPEIDVIIVAYLSKVFYVVGEVGRPGKFYMRGNTINVREALFQAGLPTHAAAMRRSRLISPDSTGRDNFVDVNVYKLLYEGDLKCNIEMKPGEVLYVPATVMAKIIRVISPVTDATGQAAGVGRTAVTGL